MSQQNIEQLKVALVDDLKAQKKLFKRVSIIYIVGIILVLSTPIATYKFLADIKTIQNKMIIQRSLMNKDRADIERTREQIIAIQKNQLKQDSLLTPLFKNKN